jgi:hypothetical protein
MHAIKIVHRTRALACAALIALAAPAAADEEHVTGFTTHGDGELSGTVTTTDGRPLAGVAVHIASASGARQEVVTDASGRYHAVIRNGGAYTVVFVKAGPVKLGGQISVPTRIDEGEAIEIHETVAPAVMPKPLTSPSLIPEYSAAAKDKGVWARAHLMLDIDEQGTVARLKLLGKPGYDLDRIAIREAFRLRFEPARDRVGRPTGALYLWSYEWPSYWWMAQHRFAIERLPEEVAKVPCKGAGGTRSYYRDCSKADPSKGVAEPWIERPRR